MTTTTTAEAQPATLAGDLSAWIDHIDEALAPVAASGADAAAIGRLAVTLRQGRALYAQLDEDQADDDTADFMRQADRMLALIETILGRARAAAS